MRTFLSAFLICLTFVLSGCQYIEFVPKPIPKSTPYGPEVINVLLGLLQKQEKNQIETPDYSSSLGELIKLGTPEGILLRLRYNSLGISLVEAIKLARDDQIMARLFELVQWSELDDVRSEALVTLAHFSDPKDYIYFETALRENEGVGIRLAAIEALQKWGLPEGWGLLEKSMRDPWSPLAQVLAAQALVSLGDSSGLKVLFDHLDHRSWIIRAMAARYLGDYADPDDYKKLFRAFSRERQNNFVLAELAIAVLKLLSQRDERISYSSLAKGNPDIKKVSYIVTDDNVVEMEPLIIVPPRLYIPDSVRIAQTINNRLLDLIQNRLDEELDIFEKEDPNLQDLYKLSTPTGVALQTRYDQLSLLVIQGLGGTRDEIIRTELRRMAREDNSDLVRASALVSLAYASKEEDMLILGEGLASEKAVVRFGAMEAVLVGKFKNFDPDLIEIATSDPIPAFRVFAMRILMVLGNLTGRNLILADLRDPDWPARAMRFWYLGRYGNDQDFQALLAQLTTEDNPFVLSELALGVSRLAPLD